MSVEFFDDLIDTDMDNEGGKMANSDSKGNYLNRLIDGCECFRMSFIEDARAELASLRATVAERDAAIARERAEEREACAALAESMKETSDGTNRSGWGKANAIAAAIRARGDAKENNQ